MLRHAQHDTTLIVTLSSLKGDMVEKIKGTYMENEK